MARARRNSEHRPAAPLTLSVQYGIASERLPSPGRLRRWARAALLSEAQVTLRLVGAREGRALNRAFRGQDHATNVLTFAYLDSRVLSGDIALCAPVIAREARAQRKPVDAHYAHLVVHGMLHLQGYVHDNSKDAAIMEALEAEIVVKLGYADPYKLG
jgi:probable rRNA maturation factor